MVLFDQVFGKITLYGQEMGMYSQWILTPKSKMGMYPMDIDSHFHNANALYFIWNVNSINLGKKACKLNYMQINVVEIEGIIVINFVTSP